MSREFSNITELVTALIKDKNLDKDTKIEMLSKYIETYEYKMVSSFQTNTQLIKNNETLKFMKNAKTELLEG